MRPAIKSARARTAAIGVWIAASALASEAHAQRPTRATTPQITVVNTTGPIPTNFRFTERVGNQVYVAWDPTPGATRYYVERRLSANDPNPTTRTVVEPYFVDNVGLPPNFTITYEVTTENPTKGPGTATTSFRTRDNHPVNVFARYDAGKGVLFQWRDPVLPVSIKHFYLAGINGAPSFVVPATQSFWWANVPSGTHSWALLMYFDAPGGIHESNLETAPRVTVVVP